MRKLFLVVVGIVVVFMLKQMFLLSPSIGANNIWILTGTVLLAIITIENYVLSQRAGAVHASAQAETIGDRVRRASVAVGVDLKLELILRTVLKNDGKLAAIKALREETGMGLRDAKDFIETLEAS